MQKFMSGDGGPAFWTMTVSDEGEDYCRIEGSMTLRDWFAGQALAGLISRLDLYGSNRDAAEADIAGAAYDIADRMIAIKLLARERSE